MTNAMEAISASKEIYYPSEAVIANANVPDYLELAQEGDRRSGLLLGRRGQGTD